MIPPGAFADGVYIMLGSLSPGLHHVSFSAAEGAAGPFGAFNQNISYALTVTG